MTLPIIGQDKIIDDQCAAGLQRLSKFPKNFDVVFGRLLVSDVPVDCIVILAGAEIDLMKITVDRFKAVGDTEVSDKSLRDLVDGGPIELDPLRLFVGSEPHSRPYA